MNFSGLNVIDYAVLAVAGTAVSLASATPALINGKVSGKTVRRMFISNTGNDIGWRADGTAPAAGTSHVLKADDSLSFTGANYKQLISAIQFIQIAATSTLSITYFD